MKQSILIFALVAFVLNVSNAQSTGSAAMTSGATMVLETTTLDYGTIAQHSDKFRTVQFTNTGTVPLIIKKADGSCGCTVPTYPKTPIAPGKTAEIKISYDTKRLGTFNKTVTIQTNAGVKVLKVKGNVVAKSTTPRNESRSILDQ